MKELNKDFYANLPGIICVMLEDGVIPELNKDPRFPEVWEEYRQHVLTSTMDEVRMPYYIFKKLKN